MTEAGANFDYQRGIARMWWPKGIELRFELMRLDRRTGEISAEVTALGSQNGSAVHMVHRARLNLLSTRGRAEMVRYLNQRCKGVDWTGHLEAASYQVVEAHRQGPPAILLRDAKEPPAAGELLQPLLIRDDAVILFGDGGAAKSYIGLAAAISIHTGQPMLGWLRPQARLRVAYLDFEWKDWQHRKRLRKLWGDTELPDLVYVPCKSTGPLSQQVDRLRRIFTEHQIEYAVIDSVGLACDGPPEEASSALSFFSALGQLEVGSCLLAHINRSKDTDRPFGSTFWHNSARRTWFVQKTREEDNVLRLALFNRKANDGPHQKPLGLEFEFGDRVTINTLSAADVMEETGNEQGRKALHVRLVDLLAGGGEGATYLEAATELETTYDTIRNLVGRDLGRTFRTWKDGRTTRIGLNQVGTR